MNVPVSTSHAVGNNSCPCEAQIFPPSDLDLAVLSVLSFFEAREIPADQAPFPGEPDRIFTSNYEVNWQAVYEFHANASKARDRNARQRRWHAHQAVLIRKRHLRRPEAYWTWQAALERAERERAEARIL